MIDISIWMTKAWVTRFNAQSNKNYVHSTHLTPLLESQLLQDLFTNAIF